MNVYVLDDKGKRILNKKSVNKKENNAYMLKRCEPDDDHINECLKCWPCMKGNEFEIWKQLRKAEGYVVEAEPYYEPEWQSDYPHWSNYMARCFSNGDGASWYDGKGLGKDLQESFLKNGIDLYICNNILHDGVQEWKTDMNTYLTFKDWYPAIDPTTMNSFHINVKKFLIVSLYTKVEHQTH
uniref:Orfan n=1 Tax=Meloidogyne hapla TaxID=6305 RepID=A0A1I8B904_MELHA